MKRLIPLYLIIMLIFSSCTAKITVPPLPVSFDQRAKVTLGDFSYECKMRKADDKLVVTVVSTNARAMTMIYDKLNTSFSYEGMTCDVPSDSLPKTNAPFVLLQALDVLYAQETLVPSVVNEGYRYQGELPLGSFVLLISDSGKLVSFSMSAIDLIIEFEAL